MMPTINLSAVYPEIVIALFALIVLLLQAFASTRAKNYFGYFSLIGIVTAIFIVFFKPSPFDFKSVEYAFNGMWVVDNYGRFFKLIFLLGSGLTILISIKYVENEGIQHGEYFALILVCDTRHDGNGQRDRVDDPVSGY